MKKLIALIVLVLAVFTMTSCSFSKEGKLKHQIKTELKKEAKANGVKLQINELETVTLDTIPNEFNLQYLNHASDANFYLREADRTMDHADFARRWGDWDGYTSTELLDQADSLIKLAEKEHQIAMDELSVNKRTCYIVYMDNLGKVGSLPIRVKSIHVFEYNKNKKDFEEIYSAEVESKERFEKYCN